MKFDSFTLFSIQKANQLILPNHNLKNLPIIFFDQFLIFKKHWKEKLLNINEILGLMILLVSCDFARFE